MIMPPVSTMPFKFPLPPAPQVSPAELATRLDRTRAEMAAARVDCIVLTSRSNFEYYTDHQTLTWAYNARPLFAVITPHKLFVVASRAEARNIELRERAFESVYYEGYLPEAAAAVTRSVAAAGSATTRLTVDYGQDNFGRGSLELVEGLQELNPSQRVVSGMGIVWRVRMIKSPFEVALKRASFAIVNAAFDEVIREAHVDMTEVELLRRMQAAIIQNGAERADPIAMLFSKGDFIYNRMPGERRLEAGHTIWTDFRSTYGGYPADRNRIAYVGEPDAQSILTYSTIRALTLEVCSARIGHGGGLDVTEPPSISAASNEVLQEGMVLHIEPKLEANGAVFQFEEVVCLGEGGNDFLSAPHPETIPVVPV